MINKKKTSKIEFKLDEDMLKKYKELCEFNGYDMSKRLRLLIQAEIDFNESDRNLVDIIKKEK